MKFSIAGTSALVLGLFPACSTVLPEPEAATAIPTIVAEQPRTTGLCGGLVDADLRKAIADFRSHTDGVERLYEPTGPKRPSQHVGVLVRVNAAPGMTPEWLERVLLCNAAAAAGARSPLALAGVRSEISSTSTGFVVALRTNNTVVAEEVLRRANAGEW